MKIFTEPKSTKASGEDRTVKKGPRGKKRVQTPEKKPIGEREIREKLATHVETSNTAKSKVLKQNSKQFGAGFMSDEARPALAEPQKVADSVKEAHLLMSDVNLNDPKDPATQEKLKSVLSKGAFNFNPREKETLEKILSGN